MFVPRVPRPQANAVPSSTRAASCRPRDGAARRALRSPARDAAPGASWDFRHVPILPPEHARTVGAAFPSRDAAEGGADTRRRAKDGIDGVYAHSSSCGCAHCSGGGKDLGRDAGAAAGSSPAASGASGAAKKVSVYPVSLPGSSRSPSPDITKANTVWSQCSVTVSEVGGESWDTDVLDRLAPIGVLNEFPRPSSPTVEEIEMLDYRPGGASAIHVYYVPSMSSGSRGEAFIPTVTPTLPRAVVVSDSAASDTLAHELGHVLLSDGSHHSDPDNLMASGAIRNVGVDKLDATQCGKV